MKPKVDDPRLLVLEEHRKTRRRRLVLGLLAAVVAQGMYMAAQADSGQRASAIRVKLDAAHHNFHTVEGRYAPLARLLSESGFEVSAYRDTITARGLKTTDILVIANALHERNVNHWAKPVLPALTAAEVTAISTWVEAGGSLLLIADHFPFPGAIANLAAAFGFEFVDGFALDPSMSQVDLFDRRDGSLRPHKGITEGVDNPVTRVAAFTGSAFKAPRDARALLALPERYVVWLPERAWEFNPQTPRVPAEGLLQGATRDFGRGRVAVFAEAALFTRQAAPNAEGGSIGFEHPRARDNRAFIRNVFRWLGESRPQTASDRR